MKFEYEYSRIGVASVVRAQTLCCGETHVDAVVLAVRVVFVCLVCMIRKFGLYTLSLRNEKEYPKLCFVSVVLGIHEISYAISCKFMLQALYWLETASKNILAIG